MPLDQQNVPVVFDKGLQTKNDPKTMVSGFMTILENVFFTTPTSYKKRNGYTALSQNILGGGSISSGVASGTLGNNLTLLDGSNLYSYSESESLFINKGAKQTLSLSTVPIATTAQNATGIDSAIHSSGAQCTVWVDSSTNHINYVVFDSITQTPITANIDTGVTGFPIVKVLPNNKFILLYTNSGNSHLNYILISVSTPSSFTVNDAGPDLFAWQKLDAFVNSTNVYVLSGNEDIAKYDLNMTFINKMTTYENTDDSQGCLNYDPIGNHLWAVYSGPTGHVSFYIVDMNLSVVTAQTHVSGSTPGLPMTTILTNQILYYFSDITQTFSATTYIPQYQEHLIYSGSFDSTGTPVLADYVFSRGAGLSSKAFLSKFGVPTILAGTNSTLQSSYFLMSPRQYSTFNYGSVAARLASGLGFNGSLSAFNLPQVSLVSSGIYSVPFLQQLNPVSVNGTVTASLGIYGATFNYNQKPQRVEIANNLHYNGGLLSVFDGNGSIEHGFNLYPEGLSSLAYNLGGCMSQGSYQYKAIYQWTDNFGQIQRSATSPVTTINPTTFSAQASAGTGTTTLIVGSGMKQMAPGYQVVTTLFPANSVIQSITAPTTATLNTTAPATATAPATFTPQLMFSVTALDPVANTLTITPVATKFINANYTASSNQIFVTDTSGLAVGQGIQSNNADFAGGTTITAITPTQTGATLTVSHTASFAGTNVILNVTKPSGTFLLSQVLKIGQTVNCTDAPANSLIKAIDDIGNKITIDLPIIANNPATSTLYITNMYQGIVVVPTLRITDKVETNQKVQITLYRTLVNQTVFHRIGQIQNDITADNIVFVDNIPDSQLSGNEQLYTTGGVLDNSPGPASVGMTTFKNRVILVPSENPYTWLPSKQVVQGAPVEFSSFLAQTIDAKGGPIYAVGAMDDKIIFFKAKNLFYVVGTGPASNGLNNTFSYPESILTDQGSTNQSSIVAIPQGLMFQSDNGIYLLDRKLETSYIGSPVEIYNGSTVTSALLIPGTTQVRFTLDSGVALVYDYLVNDWTVFTNHAAVDGVIYNKIFTYLQSNGLLLKEAPGVYSDNGVAISRKLQTGWMTVAGLQGFQRAYEMLILGTYQSPHSMVVQIAQDFVSTPTQTDTIVISGPITPFQYRIQFARQTCESIQITLYDVDTVPLGAGADLSGMSFLVGVKKGLNKMPAAVTYG